MRRVKSGERCEQPAPCLGGERACHKSSDGEADIRFAKGHGHGVPGQCDPFDGGAGGYYLGGRSPPVGLTVIVVNDDSLDNEFLLKLQRHLHDYFGIEHSTIQVETSRSGNGCMLDRHKCE